MTCTDPEHKCKTYSIWNRLIEKPDYSLKEILVQLCHPQLTKAKVQKEDSPPTDEVTTVHDSFNAFSKPPLDQLLDLEKQVHVQNLQLGFSLVCCFSFFPNMLYRRAL